ncbi:MAG: hypothetical protein AAB466_14075 [Verrucomicrobiota bacterium]
MGAAAADQGRSVVDGRATVDGGESAVSRAVHTVKASRDKELERLKGRLLETVPIRLTPKTTTGRGLAAPWNTAGGGRDWTLEVNLIGMLETFSHEGGKRQ